MSLTINCRPESKVFYHGSSTACNIGDMLLPPEATDTLSEKGRKKNLDRVFFTEDKGSADVYAGRACRQFGGEPVLYRVIPMSDVVCLNANKGTTVYHANWAFVEVVA